MKEIFTFLESSSTEFFTLIITVVISLTSIPMTIKNLKKGYDESKNIQIQLKNLDIEESGKELKKEILQIIENGESNSVVFNENKENTLFYKQNALEELSEKRKTDKFLKMTSFILAVVMSVLGTIILFVGIVICLFSSREVGWITTSSGAIIEVVAGIYFWLVSRTMKEVKDNSKQLEKTENLLTAMELIEKISDTEMKNETYKSMINVLLTQGDEHGKNNE